MAKDFFLKESHQVLTSERTIRPVYQIQSRSGSDEVVVILLSFLDY